VVDGYTLFANNSFWRLEKVGPGPQGGVYVNNHVQDSALLFSGATGSIVGGSISSLFAGAADGNFAPAAGGALATNLRPPVVTNDLGGKKRANLAPVGAVAG
jgi:hypothetical protein